MIVLLTNEDIEANPRTQESLKYLCFFADKSSKTTSTEAYMYCSSKLNRYNNTEAGNTMNTKRQYYYKVKKRKNINCF